MRYKIQVYKHRRKPTSGNWWAAKMKFSGWWLIHVVLAGFWFSIIIDKLNKGD